MKVKVLFFGATADAAGKREAIFDVSHASAASAFREIVEAYPSLSRHKLLFAVNEQYVDGDAKLSEGDELAIFTAVSGG